MNTNLGRTECAVLTNKSGADKAFGDVVIADVANAISFTTTTTDGFINGRIGVILEPNGIANNAPGLVAFSGYVPRINLASAAALGDYVKSHTVAGQGTPHAMPPQSGDFAQVLETGANPSAMLFGCQIQLSTGGGAYFAPTGLTGATQASRYVGATASGAPTAGTFLVGDFVIDRSGSIWICTVAGSPGTWIAPGGASITYPYSASIFAHLGWAIDSGDATITIQNDGNEYYLNVYKASSGQWIQFNVACASGTYNLDLFYYKAPNAPIVDISIDGTVVVNDFDMYGGSYLPHQKNTTTGITIPTDGNHTVRVTSVGKNGSSSGYGFGLFHILLNRTGS